jgi:hypothetical protein
VPEAGPLIEAGWTPIDSRNRYWRYERLYGEAVFDVWDAARIQDRRQPPETKPTRALACFCPVPLELDAGECARCARRLAA